MSRASLKPVPASRVLNVLTLVAFIQTVAAVLKPDLQWTINIEQAQFLEIRLTTSVHIPKITELVRLPSCVHEQALVFVSGT